MTNGKTKSKPTERATNNPDCENPFCVDGGEIETPEGWMCAECAGVLK